MILSLSPERMLEEIYAHSAAARLAAGEGAPTVLGSEHAAMLRRLLEEALAAVLGELSPWVRRSALSSSPLSEMLELEVDAPDGVDGTTLRRLIESAVVADVLECAGIDCGSRRRERALAAFRAAVALYDKPGSITAAC